MSSAGLPDPERAGQFPLTVAWSSSEAYLPAERTTSCQEARVPSPYVRPCRSGHREGPSPQGPSPSVCLIDRIHDRAVFRRFGRDADRSRSGPLTVVRTTLPGACRPAVAFAIPRKVGNAVVRNRLRRQLRAAVLELCREGLVPVAAYLVVVRPDASGAEMTTLRGYVSVAMDRLGVMQPAASPSALAADQSAPTELQ